MRKKYGSCGLLIVILNLINLKGIGSMNALVKCLLNQLLNDAIDLCEVLPIRPIICSPNILMTIRSYNVPLKKKKKLTKKWQEIKFGEKIKNMN